MPHEQLFRLVTARGENVHGMTPSKQEGTHHFEYALCVGVCAQYRIFNLPEDCILAKERTHAKKGEADHVKKLFDSLFSPK
jgi:hypothetical protein